MVPYIQWEILSGASIQQHSTKYVCVCVQVCVSGWEIDYFWSLSVWRSAWLFPLSSTAPQEDIAQIPANKGPAYSQTGLDTII